MRRETYANDKAAETWWSDSKMWWQRMLSNQVFIRMSYFDSIAPEWQGLKTLDLGCAGGYMAETLARRGAQVIGIDPWTRVLTFASTHAIRTGLDIAYFSGIGESIPLGDNSIDRVVCVDVLEHVRDLRRVLYEIHRVLRPEGILLFDTINRTWLSRLLAITVVEKAIRMVPEGTHAYEKLIRPEELRTLLERQGFEVAPMVGMGPALGTYVSLDMLLGKLTSSAVMYAGYAVKPANAGFHYR